MSSRISLRHHLRLQAQIARRLNPFQGRPNFFLTLEANQSAWFEARDSQDFVPGSTLMGLVSFFAIAVQVVKH
jgi:hypothetical protein